MKALFPKHANFCDAYQGLTKKAAQAPGILSRVCLKQSGILSSKQLLNHKHSDFNFWHSKLFTNFLPNQTLTTSVQSLPSAVSLASIFSDVKLYVTATFTIQGVGG